MAENILHTGTARARAKHQILIHTTVSPLAEDSALGELAWYDTDKGPLPVSPSVLQQLAPKTSQRRTLQNQPGSALEMVSQPEDIGPDRQTFDKLGNQRAIPPAPGKPLLPKPLYSRGHRTPESTTLKRTAKPRATNVPLSPTAHYDASLLKRDTDANDVAHGGGQDSRPAISSGSEKDHPRHQRQLK
jgi:hypothetical protein